MQKFPSPKNQASKDQRLVFLVVFCAIAGAILNSSTAWAESISCQKAENPSMQCLRKSPRVSAIEGGLMGMMAGTGAALGAVCKRFF